MGGAVGGCGGGALMKTIKKSNGRTFAVQMGVQKECPVESAIGG